MHAHFWNDQQRLKISEGWSVVVALDLVGLNLSPRSYAAALDAFSCGFVLLQIIATINYDLYYLFSPFNSFFF